MTEVKSKRRGSYEGRLEGLLDAVPVAVRNRVRVVHERGVRKVDRIRIYVHNKDTPRRDGGPPEAP